MELIRTLSQTYLVAEVKISRNEEDLGDVVCVVIDPNEEVIVITNEYGDYYDTDYIQVEVDYPTVAGMLCTLTGLITAEDIKEGWGGFIQNSATNAHAYLPK